MAARKLLLWVAIAIAYHMACRYLRTLDPDYPFGERWGIQSITEDEDECANGSPSHWQQQRSR